MAATLSVNGLLTKLAAMGMGREIRPETPLTVIAGGLEFPVSHFTQREDGTLVLHAVDGAVFGDS